MCPVHKFSQLVVDEWGEELAARMGCQRGSVHELLADIGAFPIQIVRLELMDGSFAEFKYAFFVVSESRKAIAVFTEHCGYHVFPYHEARVFRDGTLVYEQQPG